MPLSMETIVDTRRLYQKNPALFEQAAERIKSVGFPVITKAVDIALEIAKAQAPAVQA